jgi:hypothetical protein
MPTDDDSIREHIARTLDVAVRSGYGSQDEIRTRLVEQVEDEFRERDADSIGAEVAHFEAALERAWTVQLEAEATWEPRTVNDRLDAAFDELRQRGVVALQDAGYTMSDGWEDIHDAAREIDGAWGGVFFHRQDVERAVDGGGLLLAFGAFVGGSEHEPESLRLAREVCDVLAAHDIPTEWDGTLDRRIAIPPFLWQRRRRD